ncbi:MAG: ankyrin repeat domain-containing protein [Anaerostipes sp.]|nr:ankyrin repeat domain-containing protein [Anaerostipes sp.]
MEGNVQGVKEALEDDKTIANKRFSILGVKPLDLAVTEVESETIQLEICKLLLKAGADIDELGKYNITGLSTALENQRYSLARLLIESGADLNKKDTQDYAPMDYLLRGLSFKNEKEAKKICKEMLKKGAKPSKTWMRRYLSYKNHGMQYYFAPRVLEWLPESQRKKQISEPLQAAMTGQSKILQRFIQTNAIKKSEKNDILAFAVAYCNKETVELLKEKNYNFNWKDDDKVSLLHIAAMCNQLDVVKYLLELNLNKNAKTDYFDANCVSFAVLGNKIKTAKYLIKEKKIELYHENQSEKYNTTWEFVATLGSKKALENLDAIGYHMTDNEIYETYLGCNEEQFNYLVSKKPINIRYENGDSLLSGLCLIDSDWMYILCNHGLQPTTEDLKQYIHVGQGRQVIKILKTKNVKEVINMEVLLKEAVNIGDFASVKYFIKEGADVNKYVKDEEGLEMTSFQMAYARSSKKIVLYLKKHGGDTTIKDSDGRSCKKIAQDAGAEWNR